MKLTTTLCAFLLIIIINQIKAQVPLFSRSAKAYSQDIALRKAKAYIADSIIRAGVESALFEMDDHVGRKAVDLTAIAYRCATLGKVGLLFGFFGDKRETDGSVHQVYAFKNISADKALVLFEKIEHLVTENTKYLSGGRMNNIMFQYEGITFTISYYTHLHIQVRWEEFEVNWGVKDFTRARQRLK